MSISPAANTQSQSSAGAPAQIQQNSLKRICTLPWAFFQVFLPLLQVIIAVIVLIFSKTHISPLSVLDGIVLGLFAVALLATTVCSFQSSSPPPVSTGFQQTTIILLISFALFCAVLSTLNITSQIASAEFTEYSQLLLVAIAVPVAWVGRT